MATSKLIALLIDPPAASDGVGAMLVQSCVGFALQAGAAALHATVTEERGPLLAGWGFESLGVDESILGSVAIRMRAPV